MLPRWGPASWTARRPVSSPSGTPPQSDCRHYSRPFW